MTTAAIATMATVDAAMIMAGIIRACPCRPEATPFVALRLHARRHSVLRTHVRAVPPRGPAQRSGRLPCGSALPACAGAHVPVCNGSSCRGLVGPQPLRTWLPTFLSLSNTTIASLLTGTPEKNPTSAPDWGVSFRLRSERAGASFRCARQRRRAGRLLRRRLPGRRRRQRRQAPAMLRHPRRQARRSGACLGGCACWPDR
jgi:hypothetical protein